MSDDIFAKLPDSRPGVRSPRRRKGDSKPQPPPEPQPPAEPEPAADAAAVAAATKPEPSDAPEPQPRDDRRARAGAPDEPGSARFEDIAWAGVAAAAEAATLGVRLANKAIEAFRGTSERR